MSKTKTTTNKQKQETKNKKTLDLEALIYRSSWEQGPITSLPNSKLSKYPIQGTCLVSQVQSRQSMPKGIRINRCLSVYTTTGQLPWSTDKRF